MQVMRMAGMRMLRSSVQWRKLIREMLNSSGPAVRLWRPKIRGEQKWRPNICTRTTAEFGEQICAMVTAQEIQARVLQSHEQIRALSTENANRNQQLANSFNALNQKIAVMENGFNERDQQIRELEVVNQHMIAIVSGGGGHNKAEDSVRLFDMKNVSVKVFGGKSEESFRTWAKKVCAFCNGRRPGFRKCLKWVKAQKAKVTDMSLKHVDWKYKSSVDEVLYDFLAMHTADDAQMFV